MSNWVMFMGHVPWSVRGVIPFLSASWSTGSRTPGFGHPSNSRSRPRRTSPVDRLAKVEAEGAAERTGSAEMASTLLVMASTLLTVPGLHLRKDL